MKRNNFLLAEGFLQDICRSTPLDEAISDIEKKYGIDADALMKEKGDLIQLVNTMTRDFSKEMGNKMEDVRYYFAHPDNDNKYECLYHLVLLTEAFELNRIETIAELEDKLANLSGDAFLQKFAKELYSYNNYYIKNDADITENIDSIGIMRFILTSEFPSEVKFKLQNIYLNRSTHIRKLCSIFDETLRFLNKYEKELDVQIGKFHQYWNSLQGNRTFYRFMVEEFPILSQMGEHPAGYLLTPSLHLFGFFLATPTEDDARKIPAVLSLGLLFGDTLSINTMTNSVKGAPQADVVIDALKLLSDKSRFEIMKFIHDKEAYGNEIAEHLSLTTATVSHHMGVLLSAGLISIKRRNGKMYYRINHELVKQYFDFLEQKLL